MRQWWSAVHDMLRSDSKNEEESCSNILTKQNRKRKEDLMHQSHCFENKGLNIPSSPKYLQRLN